MLYTEFQVGGKALKLRITARACVAMEKKASAGIPSAYSWTALPGTSLPYLTC